MVSKIHQRRHPAGGKEGLVDKESVDIIAEDDKVVLAQWHDGEPRRAYVPTSEVEGSKAPAEVLDAGIPYGAPWAEIVGKMLKVVDLSPEAFAASLHKHNIWTARDIEKNPRAAKRAIDAALGITAGGLLRRARSLEKRAGG